MGSIYDSIRSKAGLSTQSNTPSQTSSDRNMSAYQHIRSEAGLEPSEPTQPTGPIPWFNPVSNWLNKGSEDIVNSLNQAAEGKQWWELPGAAINLGWQEGQKGAERLFDATGTAFARTAGAAAGAIQPSLETDLARLGVPGVSPEAANRTSAELSALGKEGAKAGWEAGPRVWSDVAGPAADVAATLVRSGYRNLGVSTAPGVRQPLMTEAQQQAFAENAQDISRLSQNVAGWKGTEEHPRPFWEAQGRILNGEDPEKVLAEIPENPTAEFIGRSATDLLNFADFAAGPVIKAAGLQKAKSAFRTADEYNSAAREVISAAFDSGISMSSKELSASIADKALDGLRSNLQAEGKAYRWFSPAQRTPRTMQALSGERVSQAMATLVGGADDLIESAIKEPKLLEAGRGKNAIVDTIATMIDEGAPAEQIRERALESILTTAPVDPLQLSPIVGPDVATSKPMLEFSLYTRDAFTGKNGFDPKRIIDLLEKSENKAEAIGKLSGLYSSISKKYFPDAKPAKAVKAVSNIVMGTNGFLANMFMGLNPAFPIRNFLSDTLIRLMDQGPEAFSSWTYAKEVLDDFGIPLVAGERSFGPIGSISAETKPLLFAGMAGDVEKFNSQATMAAVIKKEMPAFMQSALDEVPARYWNMLTPEQSSVLRRRLADTRRGESVVDVLKSVLGEGHAQALPDELYARIEAINPEAARRVQSAVANGQIDQLDEIENVVREHATNVARGTDQIDAIGSATQRTDLLEDNLFERIGKVVETDDAIKQSSDIENVLEKRKLQRPQEQQAMLDAFQAIGERETPETTLAVFRDALVEQVEMSRRVATRVDDELQSTWNTYNQLLASGGRKAHQTEIDELWKGFKQFQDEMWTDYHNDVMQLWAETSSGVGIPPKPPKVFEPLGRGRVGIVSERQAILDSIGEKTNRAFSKQTGSVVQKRVERSFKKYVGKDWPTNLSELSDDELKYWDEYLSAVIENDGKSPRGYQPFAEKQAVPADIQEIMDKAPEERLPIEQRLLDSYEKEQRMSAEALAERNRLAEEEAQAAISGTTAEEQATRMERMRKLEQQDKTIPGEVAENARKAADEIGKAMADVRKFMQDNPHVMTPDEQAYKAWIDYAARKLIPDMNAGKAVIAKHATSVRDFVLHNYNDRMNIDVAMGHLFPWSFWYTRTVPKFMFRFATRPALLARYQRMMDEMEVANKDLPEFYRRQIVINGIPGVVDHPLLFNVRATIEPLYQLMEDFTDRDRERTPVGRFLARVSDLGLNPFPPIIWGYALERWISQHPEEAEAWMSYFSPPTRAFKYATALLGAKGGEGLTIEPYMWRGLGDYLMGTGKLSDVEPFTGESKWDRRRTPKVLQQMVESGDITPEQFAYAVYVQNDDTWRRGQAEAIKQKAPFGLASYLFGAGFTGRTPTDVEIERASEEWYKLTDRIYSDAGISKDEASRLFSEFEEKYPFYKYIRTSRRGLTGEYITPETTSSSTQAVGTATPTVPTPNSSTPGYYMRGRAEEYANNVLLRLPPGNPGRKLREQYLDPDLVQKWYDSNNSMRGWSPGEIEKFMSGIEEMGFAVMIPSKEERAMYENIRAQDDAISKQLTQRYGEDIFDISSAFPYNGTKEEKRAYLTKYPDLSDFWEERRTLRTQAGLDPWYGSDKEEDPKYAQAKLLFGEDIWDKNSKYFDIRDGQGKASAKNYLSLHPELKRLWDWLNAGERDTRISPQYSTYMGGYGGGYAPRSYRRGGGHGGGGRRSRPYYFPWELYGRPYLGPGYFRT